MKNRGPVIWILYLTLLLVAGKSTAQQPVGVNDTIRLGAISENGVYHPMILLPEFVKAEQGYDDEDRKRIRKLRTDIFVVYPYAIAAAAILHQVDDSLDKMDRRRDRKRYLKTIDKSLDAAFKAPLKNLTIDQGHVLVKLIDRQTGQNCYSIIKELKGGISAMIWQSVGVFFKNNLVKEYDPEGNDREMESLVKDLEASNNYNYQVYMQQSLLKKIAARTPN